ncbi:hypothetical protein NM688_g8104 [Phlebia brevispora]|uniref:Uncharacterized protein n=1 Tax=Phlebia brevispora TaxID=194682 RepID=A0ACC1RXG6_9APHY|nr:hypothetical protein NM688_g8104 [Phlebia brevispora]
MGGPADYKLYTEPQEHAAGRKCMWPRAKLLGGCSNVNAMIVHYGAPSDYDEWAKLQRDQPGASAWAYRALHPYFQKFEKYVPSKNYPNVDIKQHGIDGSYTVGHDGHYSPLSTMFVRACDEVGIHQRDDLITPSGTLGAMETMTYIQSSGKRITTEVAYLTPDVLARPNLKIITQASAMRIIFHKSAAGPRAVGVEYKLPDGLSLTARTSKEVIVSAGAVHTPQILMLSGIGPAEHLSSLGIPVVADLPGVGSHVKDHIVVDLAYMDKTKQSLSFLDPVTLTQRAQALGAVAQYLLTGKGPLTSNIAEAIAFARTDDPRLFPPTAFPAVTLPEDTTTGKDAPDIEFFFSPMAYTEHVTKPGPNYGGYNFMLHTILLRPKSSGTIRLRSADPDDAPLIDPRYLADPNDIKTLIRGVRLADRIVHSEPLASVIDPEGDRHPELHHKLSSASDAEVEHIVRERVQTLYHPACSARMAPLEDGGVVDAYLRVHGVPNLRIVDASVFPELIAGHTAGPVIAVAEKAADLIKADVSSLAARQVKV